MKTILLTGAAAFLMSGLGAQIVCAADVAAPEDSGIRFLVESQSSYVFLGGNALGSTDDAYATSAGVARGNIDFGNAFNLQADIFGEYAWSDNSDSDNYESSFGGGLHAYLRNDMGAIGIYGALGDVAFEDQPGGPTYTVGVEAQWYGENSMLGAQVGFLDSDFDDDPDLIRDAFYVRGVARYYFAESTLVQAEASYLDGEMDDPTNEVSIVSVGARLQHELDFFPGGFNWPGKVYIAYRGDFADQPEDDDKLESHTILFGTTFTFGHSLLDNERHGAAMDLPAFTRWQGMAAGPLE